MKKNKNWDGVEKQNKNNSNTLMNFTNQNALF